MLYENFYYRRLELSGEQKKIPVIKSSNFREMDLKQRK